MKVMRLAPIGVSTYSRLHHLKQAIVALQKNTLAKESELYIFSDAPKQGDEEKVAKVRNYIHTINGFKKVHIIERVKNSRIKNSRGGIKQLLDQYGRIIFLAEDVITAPGFLQFMNDALNFYKDDKNIITISGYNVPASNFPESYKYEYYLSVYFNGWGFATWDDRGFMEAIEYNEAYNEAMDDILLYKKINKIHPKLINGLKQIQDGKLDAGDYKIVFHSIKNNLYTIKPIQSFVNNIGHDGSGVHCGINNKFKTEHSLNKKEVRFFDVVNYDFKIDQIFYEYFHPAPSRHIEINSFVMQPRTLNFMVNDICNSRCIMCNLWKQKRKKEITPEDLSSILQDPLFSGLHYIGVSGGEPTLRKDLPEFFRVITSKAGIKGTGLITNALKADFVIKELIKCNDICKDANVAFNIMVSLDGIGKIHDMVRGRDGVFENAVKVIRYIRDNTDIPLSIGCTVVKENVWHVENVLDFCRKENVYGRFRVAEFINRLYNDDLNNSIRNFDEDEKYQIALFFSKLEHSYEKSPNIRETYKNIRQMIFEGKLRKSGCPYQYDSVGLDSEGNLLFCSPKSPDLDSCIESSAKVIYEKNIPLRESIIEKCCSNCIHDYHAAPPIESLKEYKEEAFLRKTMSVKESLIKSASLSPPPPLLLEWSEFKTPLIVGWYGTETAGDKAILGDIIRRLKGANPKTRIAVASLYPFVTKRTLYELGVEDVRIIKTYSMEYLDACRTSDAVIMGGGPLMGMEPLGFVLTAFSVGRRTNVPCIIEGCGIGPLRAEEHILAVKEILRLSTNIRVRDEASLSWVTEETGRKDAVCAGDPAANFVKDWKKKNPGKLKAEKGDYVACFLREITTEYANGMLPDEFDTFRDSFERELGMMIRHVRKKTGLKLLLMPMHTFVVGNDDRDFARRFAKSYLEDGEYEIGSRVYSPEDILSVMSESRFNICMRFHSVLFAEILEAPFVAIDYTGGGKIKGFLQDHEKEELMIDRAEMSSGLWQKRVDGVLFKHDLSSMKVVHLCMQDFGGAGKAAYRLHKGLQSIGIDSTMLVLNKRSGDSSVKVLPSDFSEKCTTGNDVSVYDSPLWERQTVRWRDLLSKYPDRPAGLEMFSDPRSDVRLEFIQEIQDADVINLHWVAGIMDYPTATLALGNKPIVWTLHDMNPFTGGCHYAGNCVKYRKSCGSCPQLGSDSESDLSHHIWAQKNDAYESLNINIVTPSGWLGKCTSESTLLSPFLVNVIPNGFPIDTFRPYPKTEIRKALNIPESAKVILFGAVSIVNKRKGFKYLLEAINNLSLVNGQECIILTFGDVHDGVEITSKYPVRHLGSVSEEKHLAAIYSAADVFLLPSLEDNLPNTVIEAMACGLPVVGFDIGGIPDMIEHKKTGYLVETKNVAELIEGIDWILSACDKGTDFAKHCREKVVKEYSLEVQAKAYNDLYINILQNYVSPATNYHIKANSLNQQGEDLFAKGDLKSALNVFTKALEIDPDFATAHNNLGVLCWENGEVQKAVQYFVRALEIDPDDRDTILNCGRVLTISGSIEDAKKLYLSYLTKHPDDKDIFSLMEELEKEVISSQKQLNIVKQRSLPKISIVTPSYNQAQFLEECIDSILSQNYPNLECIIMDGGSTDGSVEIIKKYEKHLTFWQSRPDGGQYTAINEGFKRTTGEIMGWLNSDDKLHPFSLFKMAYVFSAFSDAEWISGRYTWWDRSGSLTKIDGDLRDWAREDYLKGQYKWIQQESTFWMRSLWEKAGGCLDTSVKLAGDLELWVRFFRHARLYRVDALLGGYREYGDQKATIFKDEYLMEADKVIAREAGLLQGSSGETLRGAPISIDKSMLNKFMRECLSPNAYLASEKNYLNRQGEDLFLKGDVRGALYAFEKAVETDPDFATAYNNLGVLHWQTGEVEKAMHYFEKVLKINSDDSATVLNFSKLLVTRGEVERAEKLCMSYLQKHPQDKAVSQLLSEVKEAFPADADIPAPSVRSHGDIKPLFIAGLPRTGTTALAKAIETTEDYFLPHIEGHLMYWLLQGIRDALYAATQTRQAFNPASIIHREGNFDKLMVWMARAIDGFEHEVGGGKGKHWIDKTPDMAQIRMLPTLQRVFPKSKVIFVYRHPRDQVLSQRIKHNPDRSDEELLRYWADCHREYRTHIRPQLEDCGMLLEIKQEDMLIDPFGVAERIGEFLSLPVKERENIVHFLMNKSVNRCSTVSGRPKVSQHIDIATPEFTSLISSVCGEEMKHWGYSNEPSPGATVDKEVMSSKQTKMPGLRDNPRVDIVLQATGAHGWNIAGGWENGARKLRGFNRIFSPKANWGAPDVKYDNGLFQYLSDPEADIMILLGFDWHSQMLHNNPRWQERWNSSKIIKVLYIHESIEDNCRLFGNVSMRNAVISAAKCVDAIVYNDYTDKELLENIHRRVLWQPFGVDETVFNDRKGFDDRIVRPFFRGKTTPFVTNKSYEQRRWLIQSLVEKDLIDLLEFKNRPVTPEEIVQDFNNYQIAVNFPTLGHNFPSRVYEAMACGCVLVTNRTGIPEHDNLFKHGQHLMYYSDEKELAEQIQALIEDREYAAEVAYKGREYVLENFTLDKLLQGIINWVESDSDITLVAQDKSPHVRRDRGKSTIIVDGVIFQLQRGRPLGISRVWSTLLAKLARTPIAKDIVLLDRDSTAPTIRGIRTRKVRGYDSKYYEDDSLYLQEICDEEGAALFVSTYYTYPENTHSILMLHDMIPEMQGLDLDKYERRPKAKAIEKASSYLSVSESTKNDFMELFPDQSHKKVFLTPNAVSDKFRPRTAEETAKFRRKHNIQKPYFMLVGHRHGYKNAVLFFKAFSMLKDKTDYEVLCAGGDIELEDEFLPFVNGTRWRVLFMSDRELSVAYSGAHALVYPSRQEGFGLPVLEAMSSGCPVITCRNSSLPEVAGDAALYVDEFDVAGMRDALISIQKSEIRETLIKNGFKNVKRFSWDKTGNKLVNAFKEVCDDMQDVPLNRNDPINTAGRLIYILGKHDRHKELLYAMDQIKQMFTGRISYNHDAIVNNENVISNMDYEVFKILKNASNSNNYISDALWYYWYGLTLEKRRCFKEAFSAYMKVIKRYDRVTDYRWRVAYLAADIAYKLGELSIAWELLTQFVLKEHPKYTEALNKLNLIEKELQVKKSDVDRG